MLIEKAELDSEYFKAQHDARHWPEMKKRLAEVIKTKTRDQWCEIMEGSDVCFAPVLDFTEASTHPHNQARGTYITINDVEQPAPAPRFSRTQCELPASPPPAGADTESLLAEWGFDRDAIEGLRESGALS